MLEKFRLKLFFQSANKIYTAEKYLSRPWNPARKVVPSLGQSRIWQGRIAKRMQNLQETLVEVLKGDGDYFRNKTLEDVLKV